MAPFHQNDKTPITSTYKMHSITRLSTILAFAVVGSAFQVSPFYQQQNRKVVHASEDSDSSVPISEPSTWINEPPDYQISGDPNPREKNEPSFIKNIPKDKRKNEQIDRLLEDELILEPEEEVRPAMSSPFVIDEPGTLVAQSNLPDKISGDTVASKFFSGAFGERGEAWTGGSLLLLSSILSGGVPVPFLNSALSFLSGPGLMAVGIMIIVKAISDLKSENLTPFLTPTSKGSLITEGIYSKIRHPIYSGLIALCSGFSMLTEDVTRLVLTAVLILLLSLKADKEEEELLKRFPNYDEYRKRSGKFIPADWSFRN